MINPCIGRLLGRFYHRLVRRLTGRQPRQIRYGVGVYPHLEDVMTEAGLKEVETYLSLRQNTVTYFIATRPIMYLCLAEGRRLGPRVSKRWWEQDGVDVGGFRRRLERRNEQRGGRKRTGRRRIQTK